MAMGLRAINQEIDTPALACFAETVSILFGNSARQLIHGKKNSYKKEDRFQRAYQWLSDRNFYLPQHRIPPETNFDTGVDDEFLLGSFELAAKLSDVPTIQEANHELIPCYLSTDGMIVKPGGRFQRQQGKIIGTIPAIELETAREILQKKIDLSEIKFVTSITETQLHLLNNVWLPVARDLVGTNFNALKSLIERCKSCILAKAPCVVLGRNHRCLRCEKLLLKCIRHEVVVSTMDADAKQLADASGDIIIDGPHMLKSLRNNMLNFWIFLDGTLFSLSILRDLVNFAPGFREISGIRANDVRFRDKHATDCIERILDERALEAWPDQTHLYQIWPPFLYYVPEEREDQQIDFSCVCFVGNFFCMLCKGKVHFLTASSKGIVRSQSNAGGVGLGFNFERVLSATGAPGIHLVVVAQSKQQWFLLVVKTSDFSNVVVVKLKRPECLKGIMRLVSTEIVDATILVVSATDASSDTVSKVRYLISLPDILKGRPAEIASVAVQANEEGEERGENPGKLSSYCGANGNVLFQFSYTTGNSRGFPQTESITHWANTHDGTQVAIVTRAKDGQHIYLYSRTRSTFVFEEEILPLRGGHFRGIRSICFAEKTPIILAGDGENGSTLSAGVRLTTESPVYEYFCLLREFAISTGLFSSRAQKDRISVDRSMAAVDKLSCFIRRQHAQAAIRAPTRSCFNGPEMTISSTTFRNLQHSMSGYKVLLKYLNDNLPNYANRMNGNMINTLSNERFFPAMRALDPMPLAQNYMYKRRGVILIGIRLTFGCEFHLSRGYQHYGSYKIDDAEVGKSVMHVVRKAMEENCSMDAKAARLASNDKQTMMEVEELVRGVRQATIRSLQQDRFGTLPTLVRVSRVLKQTADKTNPGNARVCEIENESGGSDTDVDAQFGSEEQNNIAEDTLISAGDVIAILVNLKQGEFWLANVLWVDDRKLRVHYYDRLPEAEEEWQYNLTEVHGDITFDSLLTKTRVVRLDSDPNLFQLPDEELDRVQNAIAESFEANSKVDSERAARRRQNACHLSVRVKSYASSDLPEGQMGPNVRRTKRRRAPRSIFEPQ